MADDDFDLLAPQRILTGLSISTKTTKKKFPRYGTALSHKKQNNDTKAISVDVSDAPLERAASVLGGGRPSSKKLALQDLIMESKCPLHLLLSTRSLISIATTNSGIMRYFLDLSYNFHVSFHDLACIIRVRRGFGVLAGCNLVVGSDGENVQTDDIVAVTNMLQNPKTKLDIATFVEFNANISRDVVDTHVVEFVRSFRYPPLLALTSVNLEGSLIGAKGVTHFCSVLRKNSLPSLKKLNLNRNFAQEIGMKCLYQALCSPECCPLLEQVSLASNRAEQSVLDYLCGQVLRARPSLTFLDISDNNICLAEGKAIVTMKSNKPQLNTLQTLDLSFNPVEDEGMHMLFKCGWGMKREEKASLSPTPNICLQHLLLVNCNIGNKTFAYIGDLLKTKHFQHLETLSLGINNGVGRAGILPILEAMCPPEARLERFSPSTTHSIIQIEVAQQDSTQLPVPVTTTVLAVPTLRHLWLPLNNFADEGLLAIMGAALQGGFRCLESLDVSDVGASPNTISTFISTFTQHVRCDSLQKLVVFGRHPFAQRAIRSCHFPANFLRRVKVS